MNRNQIKLLIIISIFIIPFVISYFLLDKYGSNQEWQTTNYGNFVNPALSINNIEIKSSIDNISNTNSLNGKWTLIQFSHQDCLKGCLETTYLLRQINTALGKDMNRVQRLFISDSKIPAKLLIKLEKLYPKLLVVNGSTNALYNLLKNILKTNTVVLLTDPIGNVILAYKKGFEGKKLLKDLKKLLKLSRIG